MAEHLLTVVDCEEGDWSGVYVDSKLFYDGHNLDETVFLNIITKYQHFRPFIERLTLSNEQMDELGNRLPHKLEHIQEVID